MLHWDEKDALEALGVDQETELKQRYLDYNANDREEITSELYSLIKKNRVKRMRSNLIYIAAIAAIFLCCFMVIRYVNDFSESLLATQNISISFPSSLIYDNERDSGYQANFIKDHKLNDISTGADGTLVFSLNREDRDALRNYYKQLLNDYKDTLIKDDSNDIIKVSISKDYGKITITVDSDKVSKIDYLHSSIVYTQAQKYMIVSGKEISDYSDVIIKSSDNGKVLGTLSDYRVKFDDAISNYSVEIKKVNKK